MEARELGGGVKNYLEIVGHQEINRSMLTLWHEKYIIIHLSGTIDSIEGILFRVIDNRDFGLVGHVSLGCQQMMTSTDNIFLCEYLDTSRGTFFSAVEAKSTTNQTTTEKVLAYLTTKLSNRFYMFIEVTMDSGWDLFRLFVPDRSHRSQVLQHPTCFKINDCLYTIAKGHGECRILQIVHLRFNDEVLAAHVQCVKHLADNHLGWVHGPEASIPEFTDYGYVRDRDGLIEDLRLWKTLVALRQERDKPFPPIKYIIPILAVLKNRFKKAVDSSSRYAKKCESNA